jgi:CRISPR-associated protein Cmr5
MNSRTSNQRTIDQQRAEHALKQIKENCNNKDGMYVSYVSAFPATIVMNGLGQALVTQLAKANGDRQNSHHLLFDHVASWLSQQITELRSPSQTDFTHVVQRMMAADQDVYLRAQAEAMAYLNWLKQFARAYLNEKP